MNVPAPFKSAEAQNPLIGVIVEVRNGRASSGVVLDLGSKLGGPSSVALILLYTSHYIMLVAGKGSLVMSKVDERSKMVLRNNSKFHRCLFTGGSTCGDYFHKDIDHSCVAETLQLVFSGETE
ncbi:hypothetical protein TNCV_2876651 [Trichonephila clavipes]|nr:hypothetical protein TNCV_2876651 [Trichonephila clavipes]